MILVVAETQAGELRAASKEAVAAAQVMGDAVTAVVLGARVSAAAGALQGLDLSEIVTIEHEALEFYTPDGFAAVLEPLVQECAPAAIVFLHTYQTRDLAPLLAARLDRPLVTDCVAVRREAAGVWRFTRPMFRGKISAEVIVDAPPPCLVSVQLGAFPAEGARPGSVPASVRAVTPMLDPSAIRQRPEPPFREARQAVDLTKAERIVAVGRGIKAREHLALVEALATALGAELAASRPICDAGWLPMDRQVGSSGQTVRPRLYVALGISGAIQHLVGMRGSRTVVAVNTDPESPIFEVADYGIVGDIFDVVPAIIAALNV